MKKTKSLIATMVVLVLVIGTVPAAVFESKAASSEDVSISIENHGEYKPAISDEDLVTMGVVTAEDVAQPGYSNDEGGYTVTDNSAFVMDWDSSVLSKDKVYAISTTSYWLNSSYRGGAMLYMQDAFGEEYLDRIPMGADYGLGGEYDGEGPDVVSIQFWYYDDDGEETDVLYWFPVKKSTYNISFKTSEDITEGPEGTMYRMYNPNSGEHFYTAAIAEARYLKSIGWNYEDYAWIAPTESNIPVYRLYNSNSIVGYHHYTYDAGERDSLIAIGWQDEGTAWYSDENMTTPLYRVYNPNAIGIYEPGGHHYTTNTTERDYLVSIGWSDEGIGWYGL